MERNKGMQKADRPMSQPGAEIAAQAFDRYGEWECKYHAKLQVLEPEDRPEAYGYFCEGHSIDYAIVLTCAYNF